MVYITKIDGAENDPGNALAYGGGQIFRKMQKKQSAGEMREYRRVRVELISKAIAQQIVDTVKDV